MAKKVAGQLKLQVPAGKANPSPPVGPALGQRGINIMEFCKAFNARTQEMEVGQPTPVIITYFTDKSFQMEIKTPPASFLLKKAAELQSGVEGAGQDRRRLGDARPGARDRRGEDEGPERQRRRGRDADHRRLRALDGHRGEGLTMAKIAKRTAAARKAFEGKANLTVAEAVALVKANATAKFDETLEIAMNLGVDPAPRRPDGPRRRQPAERHRQDRPRRRLRPRRQGRRGDRPPGPTSSAPRT